MPAPATADEIRTRAQARYDALSPELQRAATWLCDHASEVGLLSMRRQAELAGVSPPTMVRLARALGFSDYGSLRRPFQEALAGRTVDYGRRASALQADRRARRVDRLAQELAASQADGVHSVTALNAAPVLEAAVRAIASAQRVGFLGVRASFGTAFQFRYAYALIAGNGTLFDGVGGALQDEVETLGPRDVLIAISQAPYSTPTIAAVEAAAQRGTTIVALTDSALSPLARRATHVLRFRTDAVSFFPSMVAPLALVELLLARLAARGGRAVLTRLADIQSRLEAQHAYWQPALRRIAR